jgi:hypothetical protein
MIVQRHSTKYDDSYGMTARHFRIFQDVAAVREVILFVRGGKKAAIPWIERGFPAKPIFLKAKVDPSLGLLKLGVGESRQAAYHHLCYVVDELPNGKGLVANCPEHPFRPSIPVNFRESPWSMLSFSSSNLQGLVIQESSMLPYTSDYDLGAVVPVRGGISAAIHADEPRSWQYGFQKNLTSRLVESVAAELNRRMCEPTGNVRTSPRVMHGANAQYSGSPANRDNEPVLIFLPKYRVESFLAPTVQVAADAMQEIWEEYGKS